MARFFNFFVLLFPQIVYKTDKNRYNKIITAGGGELSYGDETRKDDS